MIKNLEKAIFNAHERGFRGIELNKAEKLGLALASTVTLALVIGNIAHDTNETTQTSLTSVIEK